MEPKLILALSVYAICFFGYHWIYVNVTSRFPVRTKKGRINRCMASGLNSAIENNNHLLVIHQIRNNLMAITFLATTSVLFMGFIVNFGDLGEQMSKFPDVLKSSKFGAWIILFTLGYSFLNLLLALRHFSHLSVLVQSSPEKLEAVEGKSAPIYLEKLVLSGSLRYMIGRRGFLYGIAAISWYIGIWPFIALVLLLTIILSYQHDLP
ncbi:MAG: DUF599 domain-containing protein [Candidatus Acetothermia bacterium]